MEKARDDSLIEFDLRIGRIREIPSSVQQILDGWYMGMEPPKRDLVDLGLRRAVKGKYDGDPGETHR